MATKAKDITVETLKKLEKDLTLPSIESTRTQSSFTILQVSENGKTKEWKLWLHWNMKRTCWILKALYEYEAWVTTGKDPASPRQRVDEIEIHIRRSADHADYLQRCKNTDYCAKSDEVYATSGACDRTCCGAKATYQGVSWTAQEGCID